MLVVRWWRNDGTNVCVCVGGGYNDLMLIKLESELRRSVRGMRSTLSGIRTLWGAEWCQVGLEHSTTTCPTLLPPTKSPTYTLSKTPHHGRHHALLLCAGHTTSRTTMTPSPALSGWMEGERQRERRGWWGALHVEGFAITTHILQVHSVIVTDVSGCRSVMESWFNVAHQNAQ